MMLKVIGHSKMNFIHAVQPGETDEGTQLNGSTKKEDEERPPSIHLHCADHYKKFCKKMKIPVRSRFIRQFGQSTISLPSEGMDSKGIAAVCSTLLVCLIDSLFLYAFIMIYIWGSYFSATSTSQQS